MPEIYTEILAKEEGQAALRLCKQGEKVIVDRLPDTDENQNAIQIKRVSGEVLGHLEQHACNLIAQEIDKGVDVQAIIRRIDDGGAATEIPLRCHLRIFF